MIRRRVAILLAIFFALGGPVSESDDRVRARPDGGARKCTCRLAVVTNDWCHKCEAGYVAGLRIRSAVLFEALDAHGHRFQPAQFQCEVCRNASKTDGFCDRCGIGFVRRLAYFSRLTYHLAKGRVVSASALTCDVCREKDAPGWCLRCGTGRVGNVVFDDRKDFTPAAREYRRLVAAIELLDRCESCAVAKFMGIRCPKCR